MIFVLFVVAMPVDAAVWGLLSDEDQHKLAMEGRAPIKLEMP